MTGPSPEHWDEMKDKAFRDLIRRVYADQPYTFTYIMRDDYEVIDGEVLPVDQPELEQ
jgi:hypothetical protein